MEKPITRRSHGRITHVIIGWIAAPIPKEMNAKSAEIVGFNSQYLDGDRTDYWDVAINDVVCLHIMKYAYGRNARPYFFEELPQ